jgi:hypothetical protein
MPALRPHCFFFLILERAPIRKKSPPQFAMVFVPEDFLGEYSPSSNMAEDHSTEVSDCLPETLLWNKCTCTEQSKPVGVFAPQRKRAVLTPKEAREIYLLNKPSTNVRSRCTDRAIFESEGRFSSMRVSKHYGISPKSVRDIWNR